MIPTVSIIIVNWNTRDLLRQCLTSVVRETTVSNEILVVDNGSTDGSADMVVVEFPVAYVIANRKNLGFAKANNQAIAKALGRYILLLNSDTVVLDRAIDRMIEFADQHLEAGVVGPKLVTSDGSLQSSCRNFPWLGNSIIAFLGSVHLLPYGFLSARIHRLWEHDQIRDVDWIIGACLLVRHEVIRQVGSLDEDFFFYSEDMDWCYRIKKAGWRILFYPDARVIHFGGQSSIHRWGDQAMVIADYAAPILFFRKHSNVLSTWAFRLSRALKLAVKACMAVVSAAIAKDPYRRKEALKSKSIYCKALAVCVGTGLRQSD